MSLGVTKNSPADLSSVNTGRTVTGFVVNLDVDLGLREISPKRRQLTSTEESMLPKRRKNKESPC